MKIALLGASGQLAYDLRKTLSAHEVAPFTRADFDVTDVAAMSARLTEAAPEVIINTTAFHKVDSCESRAEDAFQVNAIAVHRMAGIANRLDAVLLHVSTDYVFDGEARTPYRETDVPRPISVYANSKLAGEYFVRSTAKRHIVIRTCGLYGIRPSAGKGGNFVETMIRKAQSGEEIRVVADQVATPTSTADLAAEISLLLDGRHYGLFHCTAEGSCSWYEFAREIFEIEGLGARLFPTTAEFYRPPARRPAYSVLANSRLDALGINRMRHWRQGLTRYLAARREASA